MYSKGCAVAVHGLTLWPWASYWTSLCLLFSKMEVSTFLHELLQKATLWLPTVHRSVTTWEQSEHTAPFLPHPQCFPCSAGVWWCLVGLCPGNRISWWQQISAGCDEGLGLSIPLSDASTFRVKKKVSKSPSGEDFNKSFQPVCLSKWMNLRMIHNSGPQM